MPRGRGPRPCPARSADDRVTPHYANLAGQNPGPARGSGPGSLPAAVCPEHQVLAHLAGVSCAPAGASAPAHARFGAGQARGRPPAPVPGAALGLAAPALLRKVGAPAGPLSAPRARAWAGPRCLNYPLGVLNDLLAPAAPARPGYQPLAGFAIVVQKAASGQGVSRLELASAGKSISVKSGVGGDIPGKDAREQHWTPYSYVGNTPLMGVDPDGNEDYIYTSQSNYTVENNWG